jgi:hypothetical protein
MSRIKLNLRHPIPDKLQTGGQIIAAMINNADFATPHPQLADMAASSQRSTKRTRPIKLSKSDTRAKANVADDAEIQFDSQFRKLAAWVESIADKDETIIASAGMQTKASRTPVHFTRASSFECGCCLTPWAVARASKQSGTCSNR